MIISAGTSEQEPGLEMERVLLLAIREHDLPIGQMSDEWIQRAMEVVEKRLAEELPVGQPTRAASLSTSRFALFFRDVTGGTPRRFLEIQSSYFLAGVLTSLVMRPQWFQSWM